MDPNNPKSLEDIEDIENIDSDSDNGQGSPDPNADQETIQEDAADPIETTSVEMESLEDLEPNDISLEENNQASLSTLSTGTLCLDVSENPNDNLEIIEVKDPKTFLTKVCYGFLALTLAFTIGVVFWGIQSQNSNPNFVIPETKVDTLNNTCPVWSLVGDNYCDDQAIKPECGYEAWWVVHAGLWFWLRYFPFPPFFCGYCQSHRTLHFHLYRRIWCPSMYV